MSEPHDKLEPVKKKKTGFSAPIKNGSAMFSQKSGITSTDTSIAKKKQGEKTIKKGSKESLVAKSLSDSQYEDLFNSVLQLSDFDIENETNGNLTKTVNSLGKKEKGSKKVTENNGKPLTNSQYDEIFSTVLKSGDMPVENCQLKSDTRKKAKQPVKPLTDSQYENIFSSVLNDKSGEVTLNKEGGQKKKNKEKFKDSELVILDGSQCIGTGGSLPLECSEGNTKAVSLEASNASSAKGRVTDDTLIILDSASQHSQAASRSQHVVAETCESDDELQLSQTRQEGVVGQALSQPSPDLTARQRLEWLQQRRIVGIWVMCSVKACSKWRYLKTVTDPLDLPKHWFCSMNPDKAMNRCSASEVGPTPLEEELLIHNVYTCGSVVWAKLPGYPQWPAMVDDDPDVEQYYILGSIGAIPTHYHVVFFDGKQVSRAWMTLKRLEPFAAQKPFEELGMNARKSEYLQRLKKAVKQAEEAKRMTVWERLKKFSFLARFDGPVGYDPQKAEANAKKKRNGGWHWQPHAHLLRDPHPSSESEDDGESKRKKRKVKEPKERRRAPETQPRRKKRVVKTVPEARTEILEVMSQDLFVENRGEDKSGESDTDAEMYLKETSEVQEGKASLTDTITNEAEETPTPTRDTEVELAQGSASPQMDSDKTTVKGEGEETGDPAGNTEEALKPGTGGNSPSVPPQTDAKMAAAKEKGEEQCNEITTNSVQSPEVGNSDQETGPLIEKPSVPEEFDSDGIQLPTSVNDPFSEEFDF